MYKYITLLLLILGICCVTGCEEPRVEGSGIGSTVESAMQRAFKSFEMACNKYCAPKQCTGSVLGTMRCRQPLLGGAYGCTYSLPLSEVPCE